MTNTSNLPVEALEIEYPLTAAALRAGRRLGRRRAVPRRHGVAPGLSGRRATAACGSTARGSVSQRWGLAGGGAAAAARSASARARRRSSTVTGCCGPATSWRSSPPAPAATARPRRAIVCWCDATSRKTGSTPERCYDLPTRGLTGRPRHADPSPRSAHRRRRPAVPPGAGPRRAHAGPTDLWAFQLPAELRALGQGRHRGGHRQPSAPPRPHLLRAGRPAPRRAGRALAAATATRPGCSRCATRCSTTAPRSRRRTSNRRSSRSPPRAPPPTCSAVPGDRSRSTCRIRTPCGSS